MGKPGLTGCWLDSEDFLTMFQRLVRALSIHSASAISGPHCAAEDPKQKTRYIEKLEAIRKDF